jgi:hypothetical protein
MIEYTQEEFDEFKKLVETAESRDQMDRIESRLKMPKFVEKAGKAKCDEMFKVLCNEPTRKGRK